MAMAAEAVSQRKLPLVLDWNTGLLISDFDSPFTGKDLKAIQERDTRLSIGKLPVIRRGELRGGAERRIKEINEPYN